MNSPTDDEPVDYGFNFFHYYPFLTSVTMQGQSGPPDGTPTICISVLGVITFIFVCSRLYTKCVLREWDDRTYRE